MNKKQKICLWIGITVIALMAIFPPWQITARGQMASAYCFILNPPGKEKIKATREDMGPFWRICYGRLDAACLFMQWTLVAIITGGLIISLKDKKIKT